MVQYKIEVPLLSQILMEDVTGEKKKKKSRLLGVQQ